MRRLSRPIMPCTLLALTLLVMLVAFMEPQPLLAEEPLKVEQFVYGVRMFEGQRYGETFVSATSQTVYLLEETAAFFEPMRTFVYYWPITGELRRDQEQLEIPYRAGYTLVIQGDDDRQTRVTSVPYTYFSLQEPQRTTWKSAVGDEAWAEHARYQQLLTTYMRENTEAREAWSVVQAKIEYLIKRISEIRTSGSTEDVTPLTQQVEYLAAIQPDYPKFPDRYGDVPIYPRTGFPVSLPAGTYRIWLEQADGKIMQDSEKRLEVIAPYGERVSVGYDLIPEEAWTRPVVSDIPESTIYLSEDSRIYLRPFTQVTLNDLAYRRLVRNDSTGNRNVTIQVRDQYIADARLHAGGDSEVGSTPYEVRQSEGASLGYTVIPFVPDSQARGTDGQQTTPDLIAYALFDALPTSVEAGDAFQIALTDEDGVLILGSMRMVRVIAPISRTSALLVYGAIVIAALFALILVRVIRGRRKKRLLTRART